MTLDTTTLLDTLKNQTQGLLFPSESDFPVEPFSYGEHEPTLEAVRERQGHAPDVPADEATLGSFFEGLTEVVEGASEDELAFAERFRQLQELLEKNLTDVRVYRLGQVNIEVLVLGRHASGGWMGVRTNVVET